MKRLIAAIASALRSSVSFVWERCRDTGRLVARAVNTVLPGAGSAAPDYGLGEDLVPENDNTVRPSVDEVVKQANELLASIELPKKTGGDGYDVMMRICRHLCAGDEPKPEDVAALSQLQLDWIESMTPEMRFIVGNEKRAAVISHIKGGKSLHGVIRADAESINQWRHALAMEMAQHRQAFIDGYAPDAEDVPALRSVG